MSCEPIDGRGMSPLLGGRWRWLGHPAFVACVVVLGVNDHVLKARYPGWWSGRLSDVAGVAVVGTIAAVLVGAGRGLVLTGAAFVLLKALPGAAEIASPVLGGVTARDAGDLIALTVLVPLAFVLARSSRGAHPVALRGGLIELPARPSARPVGPRRLLQRGRTGLSVAAPLVGAVAAVATATATSCSPDPTVTEVAARGDSLYALVNQGASEADWARSDDGGRTWDRSEAPRGRPSASPPADAYEDPGPRGPLEACTSDGTCYRLRDQRVIARRSPGAPWTEEVRLSDEELADISTRCAGGQRGVLGSVAVVGSARDGDVVVSMGADGVLVRQDDGRWQRTRVLTAPPVEASGTETAAAMGVLLSGPVMALALWRIGRKRWRSYLDGLAVIATGWFTTIVAAVAADFVRGPGASPIIVIARVGLVCMPVTAVAAIAVARRPRHQAPPTSGRWSPAATAVGPRPPRRQP